MTLAALTAALVIGTWNGNWFPSGRAEHRAHPDVEAATTRAAAGMLAEGIRALDPEGTNDVLLVLNEMRGPRAVSNLVAQIGRRGLRVVSVSAYRRRDRFDYQQDAIATTLPVASAGWSVWKNRKAETPPRGYAFAALVVEPSVTARVYAVHLKSNYRAKNAAEKALNRAKRAHAAEQILQQEGKSGAVVVAGDMNADPWRPEFAEDSFFSDFERAGYLNILALLPPGGRGTHPNERYGDSALDHIFAKGFRPAGTPRLVPNDSLSDHLAVFAVVEALPVRPSLGRAGKRRRTGRP